MAGHAAPGRKVHRSTGVAGDYLDDVSRTHLLQPEMELEGELPATHLTGVESVVHSLSPINDLGLS
jgi:hypothetical protein